MFEIPPALLPFTRPPVVEDTVRDWRQSGRPLAPNASCFYSITDGLALTPIGTDLLSLETATHYGEELSYHPVSQLLGLLPITESNDSNPYCLIVGPRLCRAVLLLSHDGDVIVSHNSLQSFLDALASLVESDGELTDDLEREEINDAQIVADADHLFAQTFGRLENDWDGLLPIVSACSAATLVRLLQVDDMWIRETAAIRCGRLNLQSVGPVGEARERWYFARQPCRTAQPRAIEPRAVGRHNSAIWLTPAIGA